MLARTLNRNRFRATCVVLLACPAILLTSCATKSPEPLISDPTAANETALPWNQQQKWEREGAAAGMTEQRR